ncbi:MAG TPA: glycoside hydrolase family 31 protein, partial [Clostridia bacterium]|nr:glycoside hydrolase family 31 protein [Clostridia bacterium]
MKTNYCTSIGIADHIRIDLFTPSAFRVRTSRLAGEKFPEKYEIPFAIGHTEPWDTVEYTLDNSYKGVPVVRTSRLEIHYIVHSQRMHIFDKISGEMIYPSTAPQYGMFKNKCILFDSASFHMENNQNSRYCHWFYNHETGEYDIYLKDDLLKDIYFIYGKDYREAFDLFNKLVGPEPMLTRKGYGFYQTQLISHDGNQNMLMKAAKAFREKDIPCDTFIIDLEWGDGSYGNNQKAPWGQLEWSSNYTSPLSPREMLEKLKEMNFEVMLIHHSAPKLHDDYRDYNWINQIYEPDEWWSKLQEKLDIGIVGTWQDTRRSDVVDARIYSGLQKRLGNKRCSFMGNYEMFKRCGWMTDSYLIPELQMIGCRRTPFHWTGDLSYTWDELKFQIRGIINDNGSLRGMSHLTNDCLMGENSRLAIRSSQFLSLTTVARSHNDKPWQGNNRELANAIIDITKANDTEVDANSRKLTEEGYLGLEKPNILQEKIIRKFLKLRYRLIPYIYTFVHENYECGMPVC